MLVDNAASAVTAVAKTPIKLVQAGVQRFTAFGYYYGDMLADYLYPTPPAKQTVSFAEPLTDMPKEPQTDVRPKKRERMFVKQEPTRTTRPRSAKHQSGFYAESNLVSIAWSGSGTAKDPISFS